MTDRKKCLTDISEDPLHFCPIIYCISCKKSMAGEENEKKSGGREQEAHPHTSRQMMRTGDDTSIDFTSNLDTPVDDHKDG